MYKIFGVPWHIGHQQTLINALKGEAEFYFLVNSVRHWPKWLRPIPDNVHFVAQYEPGVYDLAILHVDQQCIDYELGKARLTRDMDEVIQDIPKVFINHGSPMWPENQHGWDEGDLIERMKLLVGDSPMVVNSHEAAKRWGWGRTIIHAMNPDEWWDLPKEPRVVASISPAGFDKYYNRRLLRAIKEELDEVHSIKLVHITVDWEAQDVLFNKEKTNSYDNLWDPYRDFLGRSLVYINCTLDSPMPRARSEAMLSGCCVLTSRYHDADTFIENGRNGFILPDNPRAYAQLVRELIHNPNVAKQVGQAGKQTATELFSMERYKGQWLELLKEVTNG